MNGLINGLPKMTQNDFKMIYKLKLNYTKNNNIFLKNYKKKFKKKNSKKKKKKVGGGRPNLFLKKKFGRKPQTLYFFLAPGCRH
jgi:hypothetical protein